MDTAEFVNVDSNNKVFFFFLKALCQQKGSRLGLAFRGAAKINETLKN